MSTETIKTTQQPKKKTTKLKIRHWIQGFFFLFVLLASGNHFLAEGGKALAFLPKASLHAICPFGGVVSLYQFFAVGTFVQKIHESSFVIMVAALILAIVAGPVICGWVCPLGTFQEWIGRLGRKLFKKRYNHILPSGLDRVLRYLRYLVLAIVIYLTASTGKLVFQEVDPYYALFNLWTGEVALAALIILAATTLLSLVVERPWCKYACPYGAVLGLFNLFRIFKIRRNQKTCISCGACDRACPMNINVSGSGTIRDHQCISCLECTSDNKCPIPDTVELKLKGGESR